MVDFELENMVAKFVFELRGKKIVITSFLFLEIEDLNCEEIELWN